MYQSIDDESLSMLEEARAEFSAMYGSEQGSLPPDQEKVEVRVQEARADEEPLADMSDDFKTLIGVSIEPELLAHAEHLDTIPPEAPPFGDAEDLDFQFDLDALSRSMEEALLDTSGEPNT